MMKFRIFIIVVLGLSSFLSSQAQTNEPCGCADKELLLDALNMSQMAIQELNFRLEHLQAWEATHDKVFFSDKAKEELNEGLRAALDQVRKGNRDDFGGYQMKVSDCSIKEKSGQNWCAREIEKSLIDIYQNACKETKNVPIAQNPYRELRQVILQEISAYRAMQNFVLSVLNSLPKKCRPNNWFGYVVYQKIVTNISNRTIPGQSGPMTTGTLTTGGNETQGSKNSYYGTILIEEGEASSADASAESSLKSSRIISGRIYCSKNKPNESQSETSGNNQLIAGSSDGKADFSLKVYPQEYSISMLFFGVPAEGQIGSFHNVAGGCNNIKPINNNRTISTVLSAPDRYSVKGKINPKSPDLLEGSVSEAPPFGNTTSTQGNTTTTQTYSIQVRWMLRRLSSK